MRTIEVNVKGDDGSVFSTETFEVPEGQEFAVIGSVVFYLGSLFVLKRPDP